MRAAQGRAVGTYPSRMTPSADLNAQLSQSLTPGTAKARAVLRRVAPGMLLGVVLCGCGTTISRNATEQLLTSDAVDRSVAELDFRHFAGKKVYLDTQYLQKASGVGVVNADYVISSLRQQMIAARCLLQEKKEDAEYIVEARIGALGTNAHEVTYGMPANNLLSAASTFVPMVPSVPTIPEIAFAKRHDQLAAAKVSVFAYVRESREPVWQSGTSVAKSKAKDSWVLGAGPFQRGTIYGGTQFAGQRLAFPLFWRRSDPDETSIAAYAEERFYADLAGPPPRPPIAEGEPAPSKEPTRTTEEKEEPAKVERASHEEVEEAKLVVPAGGESDGWTDRRKRPAEAAPDESDGAAAGPEAGAESSALSEPVELQSDAMEKSGLARVRPPGAELPRSDVRETSVRKGWLERLWTWR